MAGVAIGWVGVGAMGAPMVRHLLRHGYQVRVFDINRARAAAVLDAGATWGQDVADVARTSDVVMSTVFGDEGLIGVADAIADTEGRKCTVYADLSTVTPQASMAAARVLSDAGVGYLRIPVSGTVTLAESASIRTFASGDADIYPAVLPLLQCFSAHQDWVGDGEAARVIKLAINTVLYLGTVALGEALALADEAGVERAVVLRAIESSVVGSAHFKGKSEKITRKDWRPVGALTLAAKDLDMAIRAAGSRAGGMHLVHAVQAHVASVLPEQRTNIDIACLADLEAMRDMGQGETGRAAILEADNARYAAMIAGDLAPLEDLLADELLYTHSNATTDDKPQYLASLASGAVKYRRAERREERILVNGPYAVMSGISIVDAAVGGVEKHLRNAFTTSWISQGGRWRLLSWASTPLPKE